MIVHLSAQHYAEAHARATRLCRIKLCAQPEGKTLRCRGFLVRSNKVHDQALVALIHVPIDLERVKMIVCVRVDKPFHLIRVGLAWQAWLVLSARQHQISRHEGDARANFICLDHFTRA